MKDCSGCSKCCEGWLSAKINGSLLTPNNPCLFVKNNSCSIHETRPIKPCRIFNCLWITEDMPDQFKPSISGVIAKKNVINSIPYVFLINAPKYPSEEMISWYTNRSYQENKNFMYFNNDDQLIIIGSDDFIKEIEKHKDATVLEYKRLLEYYLKP